VGSPLGSQHVVDKFHSVAAAQLLKFPELQGATFELYLEDGAQARSVGCVRSVGTGVAGSPR
jgi:hypothetical protein